MAQSSTGSPEIVRSQSWNICSCGGGFHNLPKHLWRHAVSPYSAPLSIDRKRAPLAPPLASIHFSQCQFSPRQVLGPFGCGPAFAQQVGDNPALLARLNRFDPRRATRLGGGRIRSRGRELHSSLCPAATVFLYSPTVVFPVPRSASFQCGRQSDARLSHVECLRQVPGSANQNPLLRKRPAVRLRAVN